MAENLLIIATFRPDTYHELGKVKEQVEAAKAQAKKLFGKNGASEIAGFRVNFFSTPSNKGGGFVAHVTVDSYDHLWVEALSKDRLDMIYDLRIEPYDLYLPDDVSTITIETRLNNMVRTSSWG